MAHGSFSLTAGGPFWRVEDRFRLLAPSRSWWFGILLWVPIMAGEGLRVLLGLSRDPTVLDLSMHTRLLFGVPMLLVAERVLDQTSRASIESFYAGNFCDRAAIDAIVARGERLRDLWQVEVALLALALVGSQLAQWEVVGATGWVHGGMHVGFWSFPRAWYGMLALPISQFLMWRWLWRWAIWSYMVVRFSRQPLALLASHADHAGGLGLMTKPISAFCGFVLAIGGVLAGAWATQVLAHDVSVKAFMPQLLAFLLANLFVALGPLLAFSGHLFRARRRGITQYAQFMRMYTLRFHERWIVRDYPADEALGSQDIQGLADLGQAYGNVSQTRLFVFGPRNVFSLWLAGLLPAVPLFAHSLSVETALGHVVGTVLGGLPL